MSALDRIDTVRLVKFDTVCAIESRLLHLIHFANEL